MSDISIAQMVASEGATYIDTQNHANTANAKAYTSPTAIQDILSTFSSKSLLIEPSVDGVPQPPSGGTAPKTKIPGSPKMEGAGGSLGVRPSGTSRSSGGDSLRTGGHQENRMSSDHANQNIGHIEHTDHSELLPQNQIKQSRSAA
ncbi:MAG: hypothetical protein FJ390_02695 [Verrucomicrobia bacterium]|nr:hypothetical protein [Verrucomicrobiota bacterium]